MLSRHGSKAPDLANGARTFTCQCSSMTSGCSVRRDSRSKTRCDTTRRIRSRASWRSKRTRGMFYRQALRPATSWITFAESWSGLKANSCKGGISHKRHKKHKRNNFVLFVPFVAYFLTIGSASTSGPLPDTRLQAGQVLSSRRSFHEPKQRSYSTRAAGSFLRAPYRSLSLPRDV